VQEKSSLVGKLPTIGRDGRQAAGGEGFQQND